MRSAGATEESPHVGVKLHHGSAEKLSQWLDWYVPLYYNTSMAGEKDLNAKLTVKLPYALRKRFAIACREADTDTSKVIRQLMEQWLAEHERRKG